MPRKTRISIKGRLIASYMVLSSVFLAIFGGLIVDWYGKAQLQRLDTFLETEATGIAATAASYFEQKFYAHNSPGEIISLSHEDDYKAYLQAYLERRLDTAVQYKTTLGIYDVDDRVLAFSNLALNLNIGDFADETVDRADEHFISSEVFVLTVHARSLTYRMILSPIKVEDVKIGTLRLACLLDSVDKSSKDFLTSAVLILFITFIINLLGTLILTTLTLRPVGEMSRMVDAITERNLDKRILNIRGKDELSVLASTFNRTLDRIQEAYHFQERLVGDLSHQLRTPLTALRGSVELALMKSRSNEEYRQVLENHLADIDRMSTFITTMLSLARLDGHISVLNKERVFLPAFVADAVTELGPLWEEKEIQVIFELLHEVPGQTLRWESFEADKISPEAALDLYAEIDTFRLKQAITNILGNSYKYTPVNGVLRVTVGASRGSSQIDYRIVIHNSGPPIAEESLSRIFERFYMAPVGSRRAPEGGFGLGLSIAESIVRLHGGGIRAFNPPSGGAAFEITFSGARDQE